jgi:hypothetical protein
MAEPAACDAAVGAVGAAAAPLVVALDVCTAEGAGATAATFLGPAGGGAGGGCARAAA